MDKSSLYISVAGWKRRSIANITAVKFQTTFPRVDLTVPKLYRIYKWNFECLGGQLPDFVLVQEEARIQQTLPLQDFTRSIVVKWLFLIHN